MLFFIEEIRNVCRSLKLSINLDIYLYIDIYINI